MHRGPLHTGCVGLCLLPAKHANTRCVVLRDAVPKGQSTAGTHLTRRETASASCRQLCCREVRSRDGPSHDPPRKVRRVCYSREFSSTECFSFFKLQRNFTKKMFSFPREDLCICKFQTHTHAHKSHWIRERKYRKPHIFTQRIHTQQ